MGGIEQGVGNRKTSVAWREPGFCVYGVVFARIQAGRFRNIQMITLDAAIVSASRSINIIEKKIMVMKIPHFAV